MLKPAILTFLISMVPVIELRGAIPFGVAAGLSVQSAFILSVIGNLLPIPVLVVFTRKVFEWLRTKSQWLDNMVRKLEAKADKNKDVVLRYEFWGLMILVAIPLPGTGAWTGSLVAALLQMPVKTSIWVIALGVLTAGIAMLAISCGIGAVFA